HGCVQAVCRGEESNRLESIFNELAEEGALDKNGTPFTSMCMDDEMRSMLEEDGGEGGEAAEGGEAGGTAGDGAEGAAAEVASDPTLRGRIGRLARRFMPARAVSVFDKIAAMVAWRENWWFYCDILAAIIASASLSVIISYFVWYRR
ncbi:MAG: hypothetical protein LBS30_06815, partial [Planctomycetota bacterium]|nr:hypothetical protein [Planctomycetota bacterium]